MKWARFFDRRIYHFFVVKKGYSEPVDENVLSNRKLVETGKTG